MPRYFFDINDGHKDHDDEGTVCCDVEAAAFQARCVLPEIALGIIPNIDKRRLITVLVKEEDGKPVYTAALSFVCTWLTR